MYNSLYAGVGDDGGDSCNHEMHVAGRGSTGNAGAWRQAKQTAVRGN